MADGCYALTLPYDTYAQVYRVVPFLLRVQENSKEPGLSIRASTKDPAVSDSNSGAELLQGLLWAMKEEGSYLGVGVGQFQGVGAGQCSPLLEGHLGAG